MDLEEKNRFGSVSSNAVQDLLQKSIPPNTEKTHKSIWNQFFLFCKERHHELLEDTTEMQLNEILKDWAVNMRKVNGDDYKEGVVKTMFNIVGKMIQEMYYKKYSRILDPFKDVVFKSSRDARDAKRKQLQAIPEKRKTSSVALTIEEHQTMARTWDEGSPGGLQRKFFQIAAFELAWRGGEAAACLIDYFKEELKNDGSPSGKNKKLCC